MDRPRHRRHRRVSPRVVLRSVKVLALGGLLCVVVVDGMSSGTPSAGAGSPREPTETDAYRRVVERAVAAHGCSYTGFDDSIPASALIRTAAGDVRQVSFEVGWDVYNGRRPGTLIAVCHQEAGPAQLAHVHD